MAPARATKRRGTARGAARALAARCFRGACSRLCPGRSRPAPRRRPHGSAGAVPARLRPGDGLLHRGSGRREGERRRRREALEDRSRMARAVLLGRSAHAAVPPGRAVAGARPLPARGGRHTQDPHDHDVGAFDDVAYTGLRRTAAVPRRHPHLPAGLPGRFAQEDARPGDPRSARPGRLAGTQGHELRARGAARARPTATR